MEGPARVPGEPSLDLGMLVHGVVVEDDVDRLAFRHFALDGVEEADELLMAMALHIAANHLAVEYVERREQCRGAVSLRACPKSCGAESVCYDFLVLPRARRPWTCGPIPPAVSISGRALAMQAI